MDLFRGLEGTREEKGRYEGVEEMKKCREKKEKEGEEEENEEKGGEEGEKEGMERKRRTGGIMEGGGREGYRGQESAEEVEEDKCKC